jgi:hypothetical protein
LYVWHMRAVIRHFKTIHMAVVSFSRHSNLTGALACFGVLCWGLSFLGWWSKPQGAMGCT